MFLVLKNLKTRNVRPRFKHLKPLYTFYFRHIFPYLQGLIENMQKHAVTAVHFRLMRT